MKTKDAGRRKRHVAAKIICFLLAILIWLYVMWIRPPKYDCYFDNVAVELVDSGALAFTGEFADSDALPAVRLYGTKAALAVCSASDIVAYVNLNDLGKEPLEAGRTYTLPVRFELPEGMEVRDEYHISVLLKGKA